MSWHRIPFIRLLLPFIVGLLLAYYLPVALASWLCLVVLLLLIPILWIWSTRRQITPTSVRLWAVLLSLGFLALGYSRCFWEDARHWSNHLSHHVEIADTNTYLARISSPVQIKQSSISTTIQLLQQKDSLGNWQPVAAKLLTTFELDSLSAQLSYGQGLLFRAKITDIKGAANPHAFDAERFYRHKNIHQRIYLKSGYWQQMPELNAGNPLTKLLLNWRNYLLGVLEQQLAAYPNEYAVASALILGARTALSSDLRNAYADTGATHVLAVSGLHVGLVVVFLSFIINFGRKKKAKAWYEALFLLLGIWLFAMLTGASPSVVRASTMFSFLTVGNALGRRSSIYNTLAASAFFILCFQPLALWDLGFQLSYLAVIGIVYLQPKIYKWFYVPNKIGDYIWNLTSVSLAAQLATLPLSLLYFHQFPVYFWLSGLVVIPLATIILMLGIATLLLSWVPLVSSLFGQLLYYFIFMMNAAIFSIQQLPFATWEGFWLENWEAWLWYLLLISFIMGLQYKKPRWNLLGIGLLLILQMNAFWKDWQVQQQSKIFVYSVYRGTTIDFIQGQKVLTLADSAHISPKQLHWINQNNLWAHQVREQELVPLHQDSFENDFLWLNPLGVGQFGSVRFAILPRSLTSRPLAANEPLKVNWLLLQGNPYLKDLNDLEALVDYNYLAFDASNSPWRLAAWRQQCEAEGIPYIDCSQQGRQLPVSLLE